MANLLFNCQQNGPANQARVDKQCNADALISVEFLGIAIIFCIRFI